MTQFIAEAQIEARSAELWRRHSLAPAFDEERLLDELQLDLLWEEIDDEHGGRVLGQLIPGRRQVILNERHIDELEAKQGRLRRFTVAHEIGHSVLHAANLDRLPLFDGERVWCRDRSREAVERQAEMFAAALLIPRDVLREELGDQPWRGWSTVGRLADRFLVNITPMKIRLERLGYMHLDRDGVPTSGQESTPGQDALFQG